MKPTAVEPFIGWRNRKFSLRFQDGPDSDFRCACPYSAESPKTLGIEMLLLSENIHLKINDLKNIFAKRKIFSLFYKFFEIQRYSMVLTGNMALLMNEQAWRGRPEKRNKGWVKVEITDNGPDWINGI